MKYAIIGFGSAGYHCLKAIREIDQVGEIDVYSNTGKAPYNPMLTTYYVHQSIDEKGMYPFGDLEKIKGEYKFNFIVDEVTKVSEDKVVYTATCSKIYDRILIATGASNFIPNIPGLKCIGMRSVEDAKKLKGIIESGSVKKAIVVGASMTGIKVTEVLNDAGIDVTLMDLGSHIFPMQCFNEVAIEIQNRLENKGIHFKWQTTINRMEDDIVTLSDDSVMNVDLVCMCVGTRANINMVPKSIVGKGILVNDFLETAIPGIYSAGDCCEALNVENHSKQIIGLWANAATQGLIAGRNMAGKHEVYQGSMRSNISHFMNLDFVGFGDISRVGEVMTYGSLDSDFYLKLVIHDHEIVSGNILDNYAISGILYQYIFNLFLKKGNPLTLMQKAMMQESQLPMAFIEALEAKIYG